LAEHYKPLASEIIILSRHPKNADGNVRTLVWDGKNEDDWALQLEGADLLMNLCGKNVNCRYTPKNKQEILDSRIDSTGVLGKIVAKFKNPPKLWINAASATIYRHAEDRPQDEYTGEIGEGFSVNICTAWEKMFFSFDTPKTRKVALRIGIVFGRADAVFPRLLNLVKMGFGGRQGNGRQYVSWIHEQDLVGITQWLLEHPEMNGAINAVSPKPIPNAEQMRIIRKAYGMPFGLPAPAWLLEIGSLFIGTETELILKSRWVLPKRLLDAGYVFRYQGMREAVEECLGKK
jgi:uncharacterized protein (TIGR01777 family)